MSCLKVYFLDPGSIFKMKAGTGPFEEDEKNKTKHLQTSVANIVSKLICINEMFINIVINLFNIRKICGFTPTCSGLQATCKYL